MRTQFACHATWRERRRYHAHGRGWSLIELMIVVVVLAAVTIAAVPAYRSAKLRAHRVEATSALLGLAAAQERFYLQHHQYAAAIDTAPPDGLGLPPTTPGGLYALAISNADATTFTATATARGPQARDANCTEFSIDAAGAKTATGEDCWTR
jgi:type IV pilus assembly protein PilE